MIPKSKCKSDLKEVAQKVEGSLSYSDYKEKREERHASRSLIQKKFGGWNQAKERANLDIETKTARSYTDEELISILEKKDKETDKPLTQPVYEELREEDPSPKTYNERFSSWIEAQEKAGIETTPQKKQVNLNYFDNIDSETAYWIGFLVADGSATTGFCLAVSKKDADHLRSFRDAIGSEHKLYETTSTSGGEIIQLSIGRKDFTEKVKSVIGGEEKTTSASLPDIPESEHPHFVRGLLDGDGCVPNTPGNTRKCNVSGHVPRLNRVVDMLPVNPTVKNTEGHETKNHGRMRAYGDEAEKLLNWIYPNGKETQPKLDRKYPSWL